MANKYSPDRLQVGGKRYDVLVKNSDLDGDYTWQSMDTQLARTMPESFDSSFAWAAKDYALLAVYDPSNRLNVSSENRPGYVASRGTLDDNRVSLIEFGNIPQNYHTLKIRGEYFQYRGSNPNWLYMRFNQFSTTGNASYFSRWSFNNATTTVSSQSLDSTSVWAIARGYQPDSYISSGFEITIPGYSIPGKMPHWYGQRDNSGELWGSAVGQGWTQANVSPWNVMNSIQFLPQDGFIHSSSWISIYGIK